MSQHPDDVTDPWWPDDIRLVTDTDLQASRYARGHLSDPTDYSVRAVETARQAEGLETASATIDRGLRVQLAHLIDSGEVSISREDYNIAYTIPPASWVREHYVNSYEILPCEALPDDVDPDERSIAFTTAETVYEILQDIINETEHDTLSGLIRKGVERLIGQANDMRLMRSRSIITDDGNDIRVIEWNWDLIKNSARDLSPISSDEQTWKYERVVCEYPVENPEQFIIRGYKQDDPDDRPSYENVFEMRELSFTPISIAGLGERNKMTGVSTAGGDEYNTIPRDIMLSLNSLGFTLVPQGTGWLDGV